MDESQCGEMHPMDEWNRSLLSHVRPNDWINPTPAGRYNLVVIGAGTAGLVTAAGAAGLGAKVALVERNLLGGDCLNVGCVPSKALIASARMAARIRDTAGLGVHADVVDVDFGLVMERMRRLRAGISSHDSARRFRELGVDVFIGEGRFSSSETIVVGDQTLRFKRAVIATGSRPASLDVAGRADVNVLTNETIFSLTTRPRRLVVIGGGPIGCELAQAFARLGAAVTILQRGDRLLPREDLDAVEIVRRSLTQDGVRVVTDADVVELRNRGDDKIVVYGHDGGQHEVACDEILVSIGRDANINDLNLDSIGVRYETAKGITVDDRMRTTNRSVYAAGDVATDQKYTHAADFLARAVIGNALFFGRSRASSLLIPRCTYTSPEIAYVGMTPTEANAKGIKLDTFVQAFAGVDRAVLDGCTDGFAKVYVKKGTDKMVGATVVADDAGELISQFTLAIQHQIGLKRLASTIYPYPTRAEVVRKLGDQYNRTRLTPLVKSIIQKWLAWTR